MKNNKKIIYVLLILSITLACGAYYYFYWDITTLVHGERSAQNVVELVSIIDGDLDAGADSGVFYLYNMNEEDTVKLELDTGRSIIYELNNDLKPIKHYYLK